MLRVFTKYERQGRFNRHRFGIPEDKERLEIKVELGHWIDPENDHSYSTSGKPTTLGMLRKRIATRQRRLGRLVERIEAL